MKRGGGGGSERGRGGSRVFARGVDCGSQTRRDELENRLEGTRRFGQGCFFALDNSPIWGNGKTEGQGGEAKPCALRLTRGELKVSFPRRA